MIVEKVLPAPDPIIVVEEKEIEVEVPVPVEVLVVEKEESNSIMIVAAVAGGIILIMLVNLIACMCCIKKHKKRVDALEREKVDWHKINKNRRVAVGDALPDDDNEIDDSSRIPLQEAPIEVLKKEIVMDLAQVTPFFENIEYARAESEVWVEPDSEEPTVLFSQKEPSVQEEPVDDEPFIE